MFGLFKKKPKILIVDDDGFIRAVIASHIPKDNFEILMAKDGEEGLKIAEKEEPSLILLDANMPNKDGWETLIELKNNKKTSNIPVLMCTAVDDVNSLDRAFLAGAQGYITKPINKDSLLKKIKKTLNMEE
ncbi:MAG: response regulator [Elusimicrobiales bacterium]|nr:response regulator [Elusimicrobiales bacterium]